jgi:hypothetical protein
MASLTVQISLRHIVTSYFNLFLPVITTLNIKKIPIENAMRWGAFLPWLSETTLVWLKCSRL